MTTYTVAADGTTSPANPAFPQAVINDILNPDGTYDQTGAVIFADGGALTLQSLFIGSAIEVDLGFLTGSTLIGSGIITGANDSTKLLPALVSAGNTLVDINGTIAVAFTSNGQLTVSAGEKLDLEGNFSGVGGGATTVAAGGELDLNSENLATVSALTSQGTIKATAPNTRLIGTTSLAGTVLVQGDVQNRAGSNVLLPRPVPAGRYVATLDLRGATFAAPVANLTLATDASVSFGPGTTTVARFVVAGFSNGIIKRDLVNVGGTLIVTGDGTGLTNSVSISQAEFAGTNASTVAGLNTVDFKVAASDGGASLFNQITVDANTILRNDGTMQIGGQANATSTTTVGATAAAAGSSFVNGAGAQLNIGAGTALSVAGIQNAGAITVSGNASFLQSLTNTGTIAITTGTLALEAAVQGIGGTFAVANGATLSLDAASAQSVSIAAGGTLRLSQPTSFTGTLQLPATGARIDLAGITATAASVSNGTIAITTSTGTLSFAETGLVDGTALGLATDGAGGSLVILTNLIYPAV